MALVENPTSRPALLLGVGLVCVELKEKKVVVSNDCVEDAIVTDVYHMWLALYHRVYVYIVTSPMCGGVKPPHTNIACIVQ